MTDRFSAYRPNPPITVPCARRHATETQAVVFDPRDSTTALCARHANAVLKRRPMSAALPCPCEPCAALVVQP